MSILTCARTVSCRAGIPTSGARWENVVCGVVGCWRVRVCVRVCCVWVMYKRSLMVRVMVYVVLQSP